MVGVSSREVVLNDLKHCGRDVDRQVCAAVIGVGGSGKSSVLRSLTADLIGAGRPVIDRCPAGEGELDPTVVVVIDDVDRLSDLDIGRLVELVRAGRQSVCVSLRPAMQRRTIGELVAAFADRGSLLRLQSMTDDELAVAIAETLNAAPERSLIESLSSASCGNALVAFRLLDGWRQAGLLTRGRVSEDVDPPLNPDGLLDALTGRIGQLEPSTRELLATLALLPDVSAFELMTRRHPVEFGALTDAGLVGVDRIGPAVAACVQQLIDPVTLSGAHVALATTLAELDAPPVDVAAQFWAIRSPRSIGGRSLRPRGPITRGLRPRPITRLVQACGVGAAGQPRGARWCRRSVDCPGPSRRRTRCRNDPRRR